MNCINRLQQCENGAGEVSEPGGALSGQQQPEGGQLVRRALRVEEVRLFPLRSHTLIALHFSVHFAQNNKITQ